MTDPHPTLTTFGPLIGAGIYFASGLGCAIIDRRRGGRISRVTMLTFAWGLLMLIIWMIP